MGQVRAVLFRSKVGTVVLGGVGSPVSVTSD